jgi:hypothetical protein
MYRPLCHCISFPLTCQCDLCQRYARWQNVQNCHGYLLLLLILLIVTLVAAQLLWQYFVPSNLVTALDHKRHLQSSTKYIETF